MFAQSIFRLKLVFEIQDYFTVQRASQISKGFKTHPLGQRHTDWKTDTKNTRNKRENKDIKLNNLLTEELSYSGKLTLVNCQPSHWEAH